MARGSGSSIESPLLDLAGSINVFRLRDGRSGSGCAIFGVEDPLVTAELLFCGGEIAPSRDGTSMLLSIAKGSSVKFELLIIIIDDKND